MKTNLHYLKLVVGIATVFSIIQGCKTNDIIKPDSKNLTALNQQDNSKTLASSSKNDLETDGYIVILKSTTNTYKNNYKNVDKSYKGLLSSMKELTTTFLKSKNIKEEKINRVFSSTPGFVASLTDAEAVLLRNDPDVQQVEVNHVFNAIQGTTVNSGLFYELNLNAGQTFNMFSEAIPTGVSRVGGGRVNALSNAIVWVVDSGCDLTHSELNIDQTRATSFVSTESSAQDLNGHGTHVAGIIGAKIDNNGIVGVAPNALLVPVKVANQYGGASDASILAGLDYVIANATGSSINVINLSIGYNVRNSSTILDDEVIKVANSNITIVIAAGNYSDDTQYYPMARVIHSGVYVIAAIDATNDNFCSTFSNYGASVTSAEPGLNVYSTWLNNGYKTDTGTSMAAPHFTGLLVMPNTDDPRCSIAPFSTKGTGTAQPSAYGSCIFTPQLSYAHNVPAGGSEIIQEHQYFVYRSAY